MMQVKRYVAATFAEALIQAKNELGTDAVIVESRKLRVGGLFGLFGREMTELTVAVDERPVPRPVQRQSPPPVPAARPQALTAAPAPVPAPTPTPVPVPTPVSSTGTAVARTVSSAASPKAAPAVSSQVAPTAAASATASAAPPAKEAVSGELTSLQKEMADLKVAVTRLVESRPDPAALRELRGFGLETFDRLVEAGVDEATALAIGRKVAEADDEGSALLGQELAQMMGEGAPIQVEPGQRRIVALVGPTGVGKTTTLAKLAAHFALERGLRVGLITSDTFRIAAVEQLRTYADILSIPVYAVERAEDAVQALADIGEVDLVLIDTGGRNHRDEERMAELQELLDVVQPHETHLVVSLNINPRDVYRMLEHYLPLGVNRFIFTKVDEASSPGLILNIQQKWAKPVGYVTNGQSVPDDLIPGDQVDYVKLFMGA